MANTAQVVIVGVIAVAAFLIVVLIPTSFSDVEYYEVGFFGVNSIYTKRLILDKCGDYSTEQYSNYSVPVDFKP